MKTSSLTLNLTAFCAISAFSQFFLSSLLAQSTWTGNGTSPTLWGAADNWDTGIPASGANILFPDVVNQTIDVGGNRTIGNLTFNAADAYTLSNGTLTFGASGLALNQNGAGTVGISSGLSWGANGITLAGSGAGVLTLNALTGNSTIAVTGGNYSLNAANTGTLTAGSKWNLTGGTLAMGNNVANLGYAPGAVVADYITLNGGTLAVSPSSSANGNLGNRGITVGASGGTITPSVNALNFSVANTLSGSGNLILRGGGSVIFGASQSGFGGTIQLGNGAGAGNGASLLFFSGTQTFNGDLNFNDTTTAPGTGGVTLLSTTGTGTVSVTGDMRFLSTVGSNHPQIVAGSFNSASVFDFTSTSTIAAATGQTGWIGFRSSTNALTTNIASTISDGGVGSKMNVVYAGGAFNLANYAVSGNNSYTGGGVTANATLGYLTGTQIVQGNVLFSHTNALGANGASNPISIFRNTTTTNQGSLWAGLLSAGSSDLALGNQQTITARPNANGVSRFTIGGSAAITTNYENLVVIENPGSNAYATGFGLFLQQAASGTTIFNNSLKTDAWTSARVTAPVFEKTGAGTVVLTSATSTVKATPVVRNGTLLLEAGTLATGDTGVLGDPTITDFGVSNAIQLGGYRPNSAITSVRVVSIDIPNGTGIAYNATGGANGTGQWTSVNNNSAWNNNTSLAIGDRILIQMSGSSTTASPTGAASGIFVVSAVSGTLTLDRTSDVVAPGSYVSATEAGKLYSGKTMYLGNQNTTFNNGGSSGTVQAWFEDETSVNPSLLSSAAITVARDIVVNSSPNIVTTTLGGNSNHVSTFSGNVTLNRNLQVTSAATGSNKTILSGGINDGAGSYGLTKVGGGRLELTGANTFDGGITVSTGTLLLSNASGSGAGTGNVTVNEGKLGGSGSFTGALVVSANGTLSPGASIETLGSGSLTFNNASTFEYEVDSSVPLSVGADLQKVTGGLSLSGTVTLTLSDLAGSPTAFALHTTKFTLINYSGTWNGGLFTFGGNAIANGDTFTAGLNTWKLDYNATSGGSNFSGEYAGANYVNITAVPEPTILGLLFAGLSVLVFLGRKRATA